MNISTTGVRETEPLSSLDTKSKVISSSDVAKGKSGRIPKSGNLLLVESGHLGFDIRNTAQAIRNPANNWNPEYKFQWQAIRNPVIGIRNPQCGIQNLILLHKKFL